MFALSIILGILAAKSIAQNDSSPPNTFPHVYPNQPDGDYSPQWQSYFEVTQPLPNVSFASSRTFAGNIGVQRDGHPNNTLFFWAVEKTNNSLTVDNSTEPWGIWLNGGPGSSSMAGFLWENGPYRLGGDYGMSANNYSWDTIADYIWIDQPVGTGFSTADTEGYVAGEDQMGQDFMGFLGNLVKVFPSLATRPLHLTGESYAGTYIPYIMKAYFGMENSPVKLAKVAIGDGTLTSGQVFELLPALSVIKTYPQLVSYDPEVYQYFEEQSNLCGYNITLSYPQDGILPTVPLTLPTSRNYTYQLQTSTRFNQFRSTFATKFQQLSSVADVHKRSSQTSALAPRDLTDRTNGTIDPWYGCLLLDEFIDYALNFSSPWNETQGFDVYDVTDALSPEVPMDGEVFLNDNRTRAAIHAPTSKNWTLSFDFPFGELQWNDPSPEPMVFLTELATNATANNVSIIIYSGNDDALVPHLGSEIAIQNTTFGGIQGFSRRPSTPWYDDAGKFAGIIHQERNWTYVLFDGAGHLVPSKKPEAALTFLREFVIGDSTTGLLIGDIVVGGENSTLAADILPGSDKIYTGSLSTEGFYVFPSATRAAWASFMAAEATVTTDVQPQDEIDSAICGTPTSKSILMTMFLSVMVAQLS